MLLLALSALLFQRSATAPWAEARAGDHDQPAAEVVDVLVQHLLEVLAEHVGGHVAQEDHVVGEEGVARLNQRLKRGRSSGAP